MPEQIGADRAVQEKPKTIFVHGKLLPVQAEYHEWKDDLMQNGKPVLDENGKKVKVEGTGGTVPYTKWLSLPDSKKGEKRFYQVDQRMFHADWEKPTLRTVMVGFKEWNEIVFPGLADTIGDAKIADREFLARAQSDSWYVEAELVFTGYYNDKPQNTFRFIRMTQDLNELKAWNAERYPKKEEELPEDVVTQAKLVFEKMAKRNMDKFLTILNGNEELNPHMVQLKELATTW